jgi:hypothetical protein
MSVEVVLYQTLHSVGELNLPVGIASSGKQFEDYVVKQLYTNLLQLQGGYRVFPPRHTLREATFSGAHHQFDIVVEQQENLVTVECKFRGGAHIDQLFATQGKLMDYRKQPRGIFITTAAHVNNDIYCYAIAHHIQLICSLLPPVEHMLLQVKKGTDLEYRLENLQSRIKNGYEPQHVLIEWRNAYQRFCAEGYQQ